MPVVVLLLAGATADTSLASGLYGQASASGLRFRFEERADGERLNRERGLLPGATAALGWQGRGWFLDTHWGYHAGDVEHNGQTNLGTALDTRTDELVLDGVLRLGRWQQTGGLAWAGYLGGGYRHWNRDIRGTAAAAGLDERYRWPYAALGASLRRALGRGRLTLDLRGVRPVGGDLEVDFGGIFDPTQLDLDGETGVRVALIWEQPLRSGLRLHLESWYEHWELRRSDTETLRRNGAAVGTLFEPASDTDSIGFSLGVGFGG